MINNTLFCIVGESGSGKTAVCNELNKYGYNAIPSYTTRPRRSENEQGHIFITNEEYEQLKHDIVAYSPFDGHHYFTTLSQIYNLNYVLYVVDPDGIEYLKKKVVDIKIVTIYVRVNEFTRICRMYDRGDTQEQIKSRLANDLKKFSNLKFDYAVSNDDLQKTVKIVKNIIEIELSK